MRISPLFNEEAAQRGANLVVEIEHSDFSANTSTGSAVLPAFAVHAPYQSVELVNSELIVPFQDKSDAAFSSTAIEVGDDGDADRLLASQELNANGSKIHQKAGTGTKYIPTSGNTVDLTVTPTAGKVLANLDAGKWRGFFRLLDSRGA